MGGRGGRPGQARARHAFGWLIQQEKVPPEAVATQGSDRQTCQGWVAGPYAHLWDPLQAGRVAPQAAHAGGLERAARDRAHAALHGAGRHGRGASHRQPHRQGRPSTMHAHKTASSPSPSR